VTPFALNELVNGGLLALAGEGAYPTWMVLPASDREPNRPYDYVVSIIQLHERGFTALASRFKQGLCSTTRWSSTLPPTPYHRRPPSPASVRGSWGS
jgi:hypothetical protein